MTFTVSYQVQRKFYANICNSVRKRDSKVEDVLDRCTSGFSDVLKHRGHKLTVVP
jgi:hypothetical protein